MRTLAVVGLALLLAAETPPTGGAADLPVDDQLSHEQMMGAMVVAEADAALAEAEKALADGKVDDVVGALEGKVLPATRRMKAAGLLAKAASKALATGDDVLALLAAQQALRHLPTEPTALEVAARTCLKQQEFSASERYAERWLVVDGGKAESRLFRAELAAEQGEWKHVLDLLKPLPKSGLDAVQADRRARLELRASDELKAIDNGMTVLREFSKRMKNLPDTGGRPTSEDPAPAPRRAAARSDGVTLYSTSWCGYCKKARKWLNDHNVVFIERDVEQDPTAEEDLRAAAERAGIDVRGVPIVDIRGTLIVGFDPARMEKALR